MISLGIESSCDETAVAILKNGNHVLSSQVASQLTHQKFGGVIPEIAAREHLEKISPLFENALSEAGLESKDIDIISVTQGPGLIGALLIGSSFAKGLAKSLRKPLVPVNHVHAHIHGSLLGLPDSTKEKLYPCLALVVSGGHTHMYHMKNPIDFKLIAQSIDDACGECFDKVAKLLGLGYPGGPIIESLAKNGVRGSIKMPRMMDQRNKLAFSYSGLKTHVRYTIEKQEPPLSERFKHDLCLAFQEEAFGQICRKLEHALTLYPETQTILVSGGVAANAYFQKIMKEKFSIPSIFPSLKYCADNAAMIAALGYHTYKSTELKNSFNTIEWESYSRYENHKA